MSKTIKYIVIAFAALLALLALAVGVIAATFNPNDYKPLIIKLVQDQKQRTLAIPGEIKLTFFPKLGADLGRVSVSEHKGTGEFASVISAKVALQLIPLLSKQLVVDQVKIDGINLNIKRFKDGSTNFDDLLSKGESAQQVKFDVDSISITNARVTFDDQQQRRKVEIAKLDLQTGKIANGVPSKIALSAAVRGSNPSIDVRIALKSGFTIDLDKQNYVLKGADADVKGKFADFTDLVIKAAGDADLKPADKRFALDGVKLSAGGKRAGQTMEVKLDAPKLSITDRQVSGGKLNGEATLSEHGRIVHATFSAPSFAGSPQAFTVPSLAAEIAVKDAKLDAKAKISGTLTGNIDKLLFTSPQLTLALSGKQGEVALAGSLTTPFSANMHTQLVELPNIAAAFSLPNPGGGMLKLNANGKANLDLGKHTLTALLKGKLDESSFDARVGMSRFSPAAYTFDIGIDRIDADRYQAKPKGVAKDKSGPGAEKSGETPIDLTVLRDLTASGNLRIGALKIENMRLSNLKAELRAAGGKVDINPLSANLYDGAAAGSLSASAGTPPRFTVRQTLTGVNVGALLKDAVGKAQIDGRGNVNLDVAAEGATFAQMKKRLNGSARLALRDGAIHGINVAQTVRKAKTTLGEIRGREAPQTGTGSSGEQTDFSEMSGSFRISNGVAHNDDLSIKSPLVRVGGAGDINLGEDRLDYLAKATVVSNLQGQGGPELQALKGLTIPVKLFGPFTAIGWRVDFQGLVSEVAKQKLNEKKGEVKDKLEEKLKERFKGLLGK